MLFNLFLPCSDDFLSHFEKLISYHVNVKTYHNIGNAIHFKIHTTHIGGVSFITSIADKEMIIISGETYICILK